MIHDIRTIPPGDGFFIAMIVAAICIVCVVVGSWLQPYRPMKQTVIEKPVKDQARVQ